MQPFHDPAMAASGFYVTGGTLRQDAPSYVERQADKDLYEGLLQGDYCYVLHARQMGKSSLMVHTTARLRKAGVAVAAFELTALGQHLTVEQWYDGLLSRIGRELDLEDELEEYWLAHERLAPLQRWLGALEQVVLARGPGRIVLFLDEIDAVRNLPFSTDEFFAAIRECYNRRSQEPQFGRLTFCLLGVATPSDLIQDTRTTPFNIGKRIELTDFTPEEAAPLAQGLGRDPRTSQALLHRVLYWTGGHPYLTQRLCQAVAQDETVTDPAGVERHCEALFLSPQAQERDDNLLFVRERLLKSEADRASLLDLYAQVRSGKRVRLDDTNQLVSLLRLSGVTRVEAGALQVRNRIYTRVFDREWITQHMPDAELRRQQVAYRRGLWRATATAAAVLAVTIALALTALFQARRADQQRRLAEERERTRRHYLYAAQMNLAQQSWEEGNVVRAQELLDAWRPEAGQEDLRGWEWRLLWRLCQEKALFTFPRRTEEATSVAFSPDGHTLATGSGDATIQLWDLRVKDRYPAGGWITTLQGHNGIVHKIAFSPNGRTLASCSEDSTVKLWDVATRSEIITFHGHGGPVRAIAFSPDGRRLASAGADRTIRLWDVATRKAAVRLQSDAEAINSVSFAPDGRALASAGGDGAVQLWDLPARKVTTTFPGHANAVNAVAYAPDGRVLASASGDGTVKLWDVGLKREIGTLGGHRAAVTSLAFSPSGKTLVTGSGDQTIKLWDLATRKEVSTLRGHRDGVSAVAFSPDGQTIASCGDYTDRTIKLWNATAKSDTIAVLRPKAAPRRGLGPASAIALSPDGETLAAAYPAGTVELWEIVEPAHGSPVSDQTRGGGPGRTPGPRVTAILPAHAARVSALAFSPDSRVLVTGSQDHTVKVWDLASRRCTAILPGFTGELYGLAFAPKGKILAMRISDGVKLWDLAGSPPKRGGRAIATLKASPKSSPGIAFSPDGKLLAARDEWPQVRLWEVAPAQSMLGPPKVDGRVVTTLTGRTGPPPVFSPDGKMLACNWFNTVTLWDLAARRVVATLRGHAAGSVDLAFSPDGKTLAVTSVNTITLYNIPTRQPVATLKGHTGPVNLVAFSRDGSILASAAGDGTIRLWRGASWQEADRLKVFASSADRRVRLQWSLSSAPAYNVYRGPAGAQRSQLTRLNNQPVTGYTFLDQSPGLVNGRIQTYAVAGVFPDMDGKTIEGRPVMVPATPVEAPPGYWGTSINEGGNTGSARFDPPSGRITIFGSGWDVWEDADGFYFLSQPVTGDFEITVEALTRPTGHYVWAQAGLMVRETLDAGARTSFVHTSAGQGLWHKWRSMVNEDPDPVGVLSHAELKLPILLRLTRQGSRITPTYSRDHGRSFQAAGDPVVFVPALAKSLYAGLAITAHDPTEMSEARFRNLRIKKL